MNFNYFKVSGTVAEWSKALKFGKKTVEAQKILGLSHSLGNLKRKNTNGF